MPVHLILEVDCAQGGQHTVRMLVPCDQVGVVLGKNGTVIEYVEALGIGKWW